jgi:hypothetical protein
MFTGLRTIGSTWKTALALATLCLMLAGAGVAARVVAQDAATTAHSPFVGTWVAPPRGVETGSITTFTSDGTIVDLESDGASAVGAWEATGPNSATATFVFFVSSPDDFTGTAIIRAAIEFDEATDSISASYSITGAQTDGVIVFSSQELTTTTLTRLPVQGPEMAGKPINGLLDAQMGSFMVHIPAGASEQPLDGRSSDQMATSEATPSR